MTGPVTECGLCHSTALETVLSLGSSPPTCNMRPIGSQAPETHYPLELLRCVNCTLVQLSYVVNPEDVFPASYPYSSGHSKALHANFADLAGSADILPDDLVADIGANDGTLLSKFLGKARTVGVEPTGQARRIAGPYYQEFFTSHLAERIVSEHGQARVVTACNVLAHVDDIHDVMTGIRTLLADDGVLIAENHDLASVVDGCQWDTIYHEHLRFYTPHSFARLLLAHEMSCVSYRPVDTHGGSFRMVCVKRAPRSIPNDRDYDFNGLAKHARRARATIRDHAESVAGIGATARATTIINYCGLDVDDIAYVCEVAGSDKVGHYIPGTSIPVVDESLLIEDHPLAAVLFSWHLADVIVPKLRDRGYGGDVIVPLPTPVLS